MGFWNLKRHFKYKLDTVFVVVFLQIQLNNFYMDKTDVRGARMFWVLACPAWTDPFTV